MGQAVSRIKSRRSHQPANASSQALHQHQEISRPEPPRRLTHISELIDIDQLIRHQRSSSSPTDNPPDNTLFTPEETTPTYTDDDRVAAASPVMMIQSPSGNILSPQQYLGRPDRVMTLEERKNSIRSNTERRIRVHETLSREGPRTEALLRAAEALRTTEARALHRRKSSDDEEGRGDKKEDDGFVPAQEAQEQPVVGINNLAENEKKESLNHPKRRKPKPKKGRLSCLIQFWRSRWSRHAGCTSGSPEIGLISLLFGMH